MTLAKSILDICSPQIIAKQVNQALQEDSAGMVDYTAQLVEQKQVTATIITRENTVLCGSQWAEQAFLACDSSAQVVWHYQDGDKVAKDSVICDIKGLSRALLTAERTALNFLQCLSATATLVATYVTKLEGYSTKIMDTRKTIPGLRLAQKYAVRVGGGYNQRYGLYDGVLIKENHIASAGGIDKVLAAAKQLTPHNITIQIEVETFAQLQQALAHGARLVLLDNMSLMQIQQCVDYTKQFDSTIELEASGNITLDNILDYAKTGVDRISLGALTKNIRAIDLSMRIKL